MASIQQVFSYMFDCHTGGSTVSSSHNTTTTSRRRIKFPRFVRRSNSKNKSKNNKKKQPKNIRANSMDTVPSSIDTESKMQQLLVVENDNDYQFFSGAFTESTHSDISDFSLGGGEDHDLHDEEDAVGVTASATPQKALQEQADAAAKTSVYPQLRRVASSQVSLCFQPRPLPPASISLTVSTSSSSADETGIEWTLEQEAELQPETPELAQPFYFTTLERDVSYRRRRRRSNTSNNDWGYFIDF